MISVLLYGRNDAHGYNLHRRVALSLNCLSEILTDPDDEIVFVDYNTPDELPTIVEALADTLTDRCVELLRVLRVPAALHLARYAEKTHLAVAEPVSRNAAARRANPANRWLLSTNTDMVLVPTAGDSLSDVCRDLPDGYYGLPRFELPEWLWEQFDRTDPRGAIREVRRLGSAMRLDEKTVSHEWIRFDAPGDFQLMLRDDFCAIDGFNEEMLLGYHVDSNLSRRMFIHRGSIESLEESVAGYHCNHNRTPTVYHGSRPVMNDLERFFYSVKEARLPEQRQSWGLVGIALPEVDVQERRGTALADRVVGAIPPDEATPAGSNAARAALDLTYDSGHVLPFVADSLIVSPPDTRIAYIGANPVLERMLGALVETLDVAGPLAVVDVDEADAIEPVAASTDIFVVDLGFDASVAEADGKWSQWGLPELPPRLDRAFDALDRVIELERARLQSGEHPRRFVLVNSWTVLWDAYVLAQFDCSYTTTHSRVRRATVKPAAEADEARAAILNARQLLSWSARTRRRGRLCIAPGQRLELGRLDDYVGIGDGWAHPEPEGIWTLGERSHLSLKLDTTGDGEFFLVFSIRGLCVPFGDALTVDALVDGGRVATGRLEHDWNLVWRVRLPPAAVTAGKADVTIVNEGVRSPRDLGWSDDDRPLGLFVRSLTLEKASPLDPVRDAPGRVRKFLLRRARSSPAVRRLARLLWRRS